MMQSIKEWLSVKIAKSPGKVVLAAILVFNIAFIFVSALIISGLSLDGTEKMSIFEAAFCTITMILDAGCIQFVISDIGQAGVAVVVVCLVIIFIGMVSFTGAVIGYITNYISSFIENANAGSNKLHISEHTIILNWNSRASEIVNDMLYCRTNQKVVILVDSNKAEIDREIQERLADTTYRENTALWEQCRSLPFFQRYYTYWKHRIRWNTTVIIREGDVFSVKQLHDISIESARAVIILGNDTVNSMCKYDVEERLENSDRGNAHTVKTLMLVADLTAAETSRDSQKIIVEVADDWTEELVNKIIQCKQVDAKCNIVPVRVHQILGQILSQFSLMPELNLAYRELFSNKGAAFYTEVYPIKEGKPFIPEYLAEHKHAIPLSIIERDDGFAYHYFSAASDKDVHTVSRIPASDYTVKLNRDYWLEQKTVVILGHNSKCRDIMRGFEAFRCEWQYKDRDDEILRIVVVDDQKNLDKMNNYRDYPFVVETVAADLYDEEIICETIERVISANNEDTSILILSDDHAPADSVDASALAHLIYVQDIMNRKKAENPNFDMESVDIVVEIIDPKHHDIVNSYNVNNVVISNRYISKIMTQIGEKEALFDFYTDILTYDTDDVGGYQSKEVYVKKVCQFFDELPAPCTAAELIRAVYTASVDPSLPPEKRNPTVVLGYVKPGGRMVIFSGDQSAIPVRLEERDKLIVYSNH